MLFFFADDLLLLLPSPSILKCDYSKENEDE